MKIILMNFTIGLIFGTLAVKLFGVDNKKNFEKSRTEMVEVLRDNNCSEEEINDIMIKAEKDIRIILNCLVFFFLFILFLIAKFL